MLELASSIDMLRCGVGKLNPVLEEVVIDPVDKLVDTFSTSFM